MTGDKTVIRGGYRITYDPAYYNIFLNVATAAPVVNAGVITTGAALPASGFFWQRRARGPARQYSYGSRNQSWDATQHPSDQQF